MFTGLITGVGNVREVQAIGQGKDARFVIETPADASWHEGEIKLGASIACSGCCLTVVEFSANWFAVEVSAETLAFTTLGVWAPGSKINLEGSLRLGDELGGHIVFGHVDGVAQVLSATPEIGSTRWKFRLPDALAPFVAQKGSIAINGVSLTVNEVEGADFGVNIIRSRGAHNFAYLARATREHRNRYAGAVCRAAAQFSACVNICRHHNPHSRRGGAEGQRLMDGLKSTLKTAGLHDYISSAAEIIEEARAGRMFILVDDEDRENEGDLVIPAQMATPEAINFMAKHAPRPDLPGADPRARRAARICR